MKSEKKWRHFDAQKKTSNQFQREKKREGERGPKYEGRGKKLARRSSTNDVCVGGGLRHRDRKKRDDLSGTNKSSSKERRHY